MVGRTIDGQRRLGEVGLMLPLAVAVGLVTQGAAVVAVDTHGAVAVVAVGRDARGVDRDAGVVDAEAIALGVAVGEEPSLEHLVRGEADAGHDVGRVEGRLLDLGEVVLRVLVELEDADLDERGNPCGARPWSDRRGGTAASPRPARS